MALIIRVLLLLIIQLFLCEGVYSQLIVEEFKMNSVDRKQITVSTSFNQVNSELKISLCSKESKCISGIIELVEDVKVINELFLYVHYKLKVGSGAKIHKLSLFCVNNGKLVKALDLVTLESYVLTETYSFSKDSITTVDEFEKYSLDSIMVTRIDNNQYLFSAIEKNISTSKMNPASNFNNEEIVNLRFNEINKVFYNRFSSIDVSQIENFISTKREKRQYGFFPSIRLYNKEYYYVKGLWMVKSSGNKIRTSENVCHNLE